MANLYYHRIENFNRLETIKGIEGYCKRVLTITSPEDYVLLDWYEDIILPIPELPLLNEMGLGVPEDHLFVVNFDHKIDWQKNYSRNRKIIEALRKKNLNRLYPFTGKSKIVHLLGGELGIPVDCAPAEITVWAEDKSTLPRLINGSLVSRRFYCKNREEVFRNWKKLKQLPGFPGMGVIKNCQSASGLGSSVVRNEEDMKFFLATYDFNELGMAVIEEWYAEADVRAPSINLHIEKDGAVKEMFISDQIFEEKVKFGVEGTRIHMGNLKPSTFPEDVQNKIRDIGEKIIKGLKENGYWGPVGFDTIVLPDGNAKAIEINPRVTGPHYGYRPAEKMGCKFFRLRNEDGLKGGVNIAKLKSTLGDLLFSPGKNAGYIPFNFYPEKKFTGVAIAKTQEEFGALIEELDATLPKLKNGAKI